MAKEQVKRGKDRKRKKIEEDETYQETQRGEESDCEGYGKKRMIKNEAKKFKTAAANSQRSATLMTQMDQHTAVSD